MPQDAEVYHIWDGEPRTRISVVYESRQGDVMTAEYEMNVYTVGCRPKGTEEHDNYVHWRTEDDPEYVPED